METNGNLTVFPKSQKKTATLEDLGLQAQPESIPVTLIMDGRIMHKNLKKANLELNWLLSKIKEQGLEKNGVFFAYLDTQGQLKIIPKQKE